MHHQSWGCVASLFQVIAFLDQSWISYLSAWRTKRNRSWTLKKTRQLANFFRGLEARGQPQGQKKQWQGQKGRGKGRVLFLTLLQAPANPNDLQAAMGGRLGQFLPQWRDLEPSPFVLSVIERGYGLEFCSPSPLRQDFWSLISHDYDHWSPWSLRDLGDEKVLVQVPTHEEGRWIYSHVLVVRKPLGKFRLIIKLRELNKFIW